MAGLLGALHSVGAKEYLAKRQLYLPSPGSQDAGGEGNGSCIDKNVKIRRGKCRTIRDYMTEHLIQPGSRG